MNIKNATINQQLGSVAVVLTLSKDHTWDLYVSVMNMRTTGVPSVQFRIIPLAGFREEFLPGAYRAAAEEVAYLTARAADDEQTVYDYLHEQVRDYLEGR